MLPRIDFCSTDAYKALSKHFEQIKKEQLRNLFKDPKRFDQFSISFGDILLDYSKNRINSETHDLLLQLAEECGLKDAIEQQFKGEIINETEGRAVLHTAPPSYGSWQLDWPTLRGRFQAPFFGVPFPGGS